MTPFEIPEVSLGNFSAKTASSATLLDFLSYARSNLIQALLDVFEAPDEVREGRPRVDFFLVGSFQEQRFKAFESDCRRLLGRLTSLRQSFPAASSSPIIAVLIRKAAFAKPSGLRFSQSSFHCSGAG